MIFIFVLFSNAFSALEIILHPEQLWQGNCTTGIRSSSLLSLSLFVCFRVGGEGGY